MAFQRRENEGAGNPLGGQQRALSASPGQAPIAFLLGFNNAPSMGGAGVVQLGPPALAMVQDAEGKVGLVQAHQGQGSMGGQQTSSRPPMGTAHHQVNQVKAPLVASISHADQHRMATMRGTYVDTLRQDFAGGARAGGGVQASVWGGYSALSHTISGLVSNPSAGGGGAHAAPTDSHNKYCHFCQHVKVKRADSMVSCGSKHCSRRFCEHCLNVHLAHNLASDPYDVAPTDPGWKCPVCRKTCCCSLSQCTQVHRHCKAYRYRRRRAEQVKKVAPNEAQAGGEPAAAEPSVGTPPRVSPSNSEHASDPSPKHGPGEAKKEGQQEGGKGSIAALLDGDADTRVWLTESFWFRHKGGGGERAGGVGGRGVASGLSPPTVVDDRMHSSGSGTASPQPRGSESPAAARAGGGGNAIARLLCAAESAAASNGRCVPAAASHAQGPDMLAHATEG